MQLSLSLSLPHSFTCVRACVTRREFPLNAGTREAGIHDGHALERAEREARKFVGDFRAFYLCSHPLPYSVPLSSSLSPHARLTHGARYWINNALITFHSTTNVAAGYEFPNYTPWQITRIKFSRMREFAYRNDGIPRDVIQPRLFRPSECSLCAVVMQTK